MLKLVKVFPTPPLINHDEFLVIAGPCAVQNYEQTLKLAQILMAHGVRYLRGGAYKARTSPYSFQGLHEHGLAMLSAVKSATGIKIVTEITDVRDIDKFHDVDIIQIGARNMQNFPLLEAVAHTNKPILLKRDFGATVEEWLFAAEYLMDFGNEKIILCERGIRTFSDASRTTLDLAAIGAVRKITKLPVIIDPSHSGGDYELVPELARAAAAYPAAGLMIEVAIDPEHALSDKEETLRADKFVSLLDEIDAILAIVKKKRI